MLAHTDRVQCEVQLMNFELYEGASRKDDLFMYMEAHGFDLVGEVRQCFGQEANFTFERRISQVMIDTQ